MYFIVPLLIFRLTEPAAGRAVRRLVCFVDASFVPMCSRWGLLAFAGFLLWGWVKKKLAHFAGHIAGDGTLFRPFERLIHICGFQYPKSAHVLLGLYVRS